MKHAVVHNCIEAAISCYSSESEPPIELLGCISALLGLLSEERPAIWRGEQEEDTVQLFPIIY